MATASAVVALTPTAVRCPSSTSVKGDRLVIEVQHRGRDLRYPLLVDPTTYTWQYDTSYGAEYWDYADAGLWESDETSTENGLTITSAFDNVVDDWAEWTYTPPGTAYVASFQGLAEKIYDADLSVSEVGLRRSNGTWAVTPEIVPARPDRSISAAAWSRRATNPSPATLRRTT